MFFIIYALYSFFLLYRLGPFAQVSVADDLSRPYAAEVSYRSERLKANPV